mmetsp:Transcript_16778/g.24653  ORF Transcript_16778/g.24653 Transcript_16778/m.24653 type:complete len:156 (+) Transcript_16778:1-468(+)
MIHDLMEERFSQITAFFDLSTIHPDNDKDGKKEEEEEKEKEKGDTPKNESTNQSLHQAIQNASLILGIHADGATEAIVDAALMYNKPFMVVPCCVFPSLFQTRMVKDEDGVTRHVRSHDQFCRYLVQKDDRLKMEVLPIEGRNVAIWWDGVTLND